MTNEHNIYVSTSCIEGKKIGYVVARLAEQGIQNIELSGGTKFYQGWFEDLKTLKRKYNLKYVFHAYFPPTDPEIIINLAADEYEGERALNYYLNNLDKMEELSSNVLSVHAGFFFEMSLNEIGGSIVRRKIVKRDEYIRRFADRYIILEKAAAERGISVFLENNVLCKRNFENAFKNNPFMLVTYEDYLELRQLINFNLLLDVAHLKVSCKTLNCDYENELRRWASNMSWVHISHNDGTNDQHRIIPRRDSTFEFCKKSVPTEIPISLETHGTIDQVIKNYSYLKKMRIENG